MMFNKTSESLVWLLDTQLALDTCKIAQLLWSSDEKGIGTAKWRHTQHDYYSMHDYDNPPPILPLKNAHMMC